MCARFFVDDDVLDLLAEITDARETASTALGHGDVHPAQQAPVITGKQGAFCTDIMIWGFPRYDGKGLVINARSESVTEKPMFRDSVFLRRCVIPARHFYEWDAVKSMVTFRRPEAPVLFMAGIYDQFAGQNRFTVLTTAANASVSRFHDRMPVLLERDELGAWLFEGTASGLLKKEMPALAYWQENEQMSLF